MIRIIIGIAAMYFLPMALTGCASWRHSWGNVPGSGMPNAISLNSGRGAAAESIGSQPVLNSMRQWEKLAADVAQGLCVSSTCNTESNSNGSYSAYGRRAGHMSTKKGPVSPWNDKKFCVSVSIPRGPLAVDGAFRAVLSEGIIRSLISEGARVYAWRSSQASQCDKIVIRTVVTQLNGTTHTGYYAGELTALAGLGVVVRHVIRAATEAKAVATVGLGELAYWLSPSYLTRHPMAEVAVSVSQISTKGRYRAQYTNVYYINANDVWAYVDPPRLPSPDWTALNNHAVPHEVGRPLPPVPTGDEP